MGRTGRATDRAWARAQSQERPRSSYNCYTERRKTKRETRKVDISAVLAGGGGGRGSGPVLVYLKALQGARQRSWTKSGLMWRLWTVPLYLKDLWTVPLFLKDQWTVPLYLQGSVDCSFTRRIFGLSLYT